jgi:hypothetical protein
MRIRFLIRNPHSLLFSYHRRLPVILHSHQQRSRVTARRETTRRAVGDEIAIRAIRATHGDAELLAARGLT